MSMVKYIINIIVISTCTCVLSFCTSTFLHDISKFSLFKIPLNDTRTLASCHLNLIQDVGKLALVFNAKDLFSYYIALQSPN